MSSMHVSTNYIELDRRINKSYISHDKDEVTIISVTTVAT